MISDNPNIQGGPSVTTTRGGRFSEPGIIPPSVSAEPQRPAVQQPSVPTEVIAGATGTFALTGAAAVVLAIFGLSKVLPDYMAPIAAIVLGAGFLIEALAISARYRNLVEQSRGNYGTIVIGRGLGFDAVGGVGAIVLGILALLGYFPLTLLSCATIALGAALLMTTSSMVHLNRLAINSSDAHPVSQDAALGAVSASASTHMLVGIGGIVLGILALLGYYSMTLCLIGFLCVGGGALLGGSSIVAWMMSRFAH
jgi:hypothetical protein